MRRLPALAFVAALAAAGLVAGAALAQTQPRSSPKAVLPDLPASILGALAYVDIEPGRALALDNGRHSENGRALRLVGELMAHGDLDGDGTSDAAVLLEEMLAGEAAITLHLAVVVQRAGRVRNMASLPLGPHVQVRALTIAAREALLDLLVMGEGDAPGRPTLKMALALKLYGSEILVMRQEPGGKFSPADLAGTSWRLAGSVWPITASFRRDEAGALRLSGRAGCGHYSARLDDDGAVADLAPAPPPAPKTQCASDALSAQSDFLAALAGAERLAFRYGRLELIEAGGNALTWERP